MLTETSIKSFVTNLVWDEARHLLTETSIKSAITSLVWEGPGSRHNITFLNYAFTVLIVICDI